jgi:hypothetical protein
MTNVSTMSQTPVVGIVLMTSSDPAMTAFAMVLLVQTTLNPVPISSAILESLDMVNLIIGNRPFSEEQKATGSKPARGQADTVSLAFQALGLHSQAFQGQK